jgi:hypothetical protein
MDNRKLEPLLELHLKINRSNILLTSADLVSPINFWMELLILVYCDEAGFKISQGGTMLRTPSKQKASDFKPSKGSFNSHLAALWRHFYYTMKPFRICN